MSELEITQVEKRLAGVICEKRRKAISYTVLTILCTPAFVLLGSLVIFFVMAHIFRIGQYNIGARGLYAGFNIFLALIFILMLVYSNSLNTLREFSKLWLVVVIVFLLLLFLTNATNLREQIPILYAFIYIILSLGVLGLLGLVQMGQSERDKKSSVGEFLTGFLALFGFIADSYGEILYRSWLWFPPKPEEIRLGVWILCQLAMEKTLSLDAQSVPKRILNMLIRLKLVQVKNRKLKLILKGRDFLRITSENELAQKK
ncbi:MAG: hypothetical protein JXM79_13540 [Sedimentisphaerales bacterium]|nr:hypothetical protein [Sedimentisphaerales bacterium]